jgi:hypothetical protein
MRGVADEDEAAVLLGVAGPVGERGDFEEAGLESQISRTFNMGAGLTLWGWFESKEGCGGRGAKEVSYG